MELQFLGRSKPGRVGAEESDTVAAIQEERLFENKVQSLDSLLSQITGASLCVP